MSNFRKFREYLTAKGMQEKPVESDDGDTGPTPEKYPPEAATKGKNWQTTTPKEKSKAYVGVGTDPGQQKYEKGFASDGDKKLIYEPKVGKPEKEGGKKLDSWPAGKTEAFLDHTKDLTLAEFASYVSEQSKVSTEGLPAITAYKTGAICPDPLQAMRYVITLAGANERLMESLVSMLKSQGNLDKFLRAAVNHSDTFNELAFLLADPSIGGTISRKLVKALSEVTVQEITDIPASEDKSVVNPPPKTKNKNANMKPDPNGPPAAQPANTPATMNGQDMGQNAMQGVQATQGGGPPQVQPEHNLIAALMAKNMLPTME
jgi:hypothetical protein